MSSDLVAPRLLQVLAERDAGLAAVYEILDVAVRELDLETAAVVFDEPPFERQLFRAGRALRVDDGALALRPAGFYADPPVDPDGVMARAVADACRLALRGIDVRLEGPARCFEAAVAHARRAGCVCTMVLVDAGGTREQQDLYDRLTRVVRRDDWVFDVSARELLLLLPLAIGESVAGVLERAAAVDLGASVCAPFTYSVVAAPEEASDFTTALLLARERQQEVAASLVGDHPSVE